MIRSDQLETDFEIILITQKLYYKSGIFIHEFPVGSQAMFWGIFANGPDHWFSFFIWHITPTFYSLCSSSIFLCLINDYRATPGQKISQIALFVRDP